jgi:hypothetical protein
MNSKNLFYFLLLLLIGGCVEPFDPEIESYEDVLVVDGLLSDEEISAKIRLSRTYNYDQNRTNPETGALVNVIDESGQNFQLSETSDGYYTFEGGGLDPEPGKMYQLQIVTADGLEYESDYQEMLVSPDLDSIYFIDYRGNANGSFLGREGVDFYVDTEGKENESRYFRWEWEESWKILSPINYPDIRYCWQYDQSKGINIATTENLATNKLEKQFVFNVPFSTNKLAIEYSVLLKQYSVTRDNYVYLTKLEQINKGSGGFFDPIPAALNGNISCLTDPDLPVLGFFEASTVNSRRIFIDRSELKFGFVASGFEDCEAIYVSYEEYSTGDIRDYYYVYEYFDSFLNDTIVVMTNLRKCYDCSFVGDRRKPEFWIDE